MLQLIASVGLTMLLLCAGVALVLLRLGVFTESSAPDYGAHWGRRYPVAPAGMPIGAADASGRSKDHPATLAPVRMAEVDSTGCA